MNAQLPDSLARKVDSVFADFNKTNSPGCALAVLKDGQIIYKRGYGMSNLEYNIAIDPESIFHVASISKQFTAAAIVKLSLEGKLSLEDDVRKYIQELPDFGHTITINHLIHHTSGLRDQWDLQYMAGWRDDDVIKESDVLEMVARQKALNFLPGSEEVYCNTGFTLMGVIVKKVSGISLRAYADSVFFKPLGMNKTHFHDDHSEVTPNRTSAYYKDEKGKWKISIPVFDNYGATSLFTTVEDLAKWDENFYSKKVGGNDFINAMQITGVLNNKTKQEFAAGLMIRPYKGYNTVQHSGADAGYRANFVRFPDQHFSVIILANLANISVGTITNKVVDIFLPGKSLRDESIAYKTDGNIVIGWAGEYIDMTTKSTLEFNYKNGELQLNGSVLKPSNNASFTDVKNNNSYHFKGDSNNAVLVVPSDKNVARTYVKIKKIKPTAAQLKEYAGEYYSEELDVKYKIRATDSTLLIKMPRNEETAFEPYIKDMFRGDFNMMFSRDKKNNITGFLYYYKKGEEFVF